MNEEFAYAVSVITQRNTFLIFPCNDIYTNHLHHGRWKWEQAHRPTHCWTEIKTPRELQAQLSILGNHSSNLSLHRINDPSAVYKEHGASAWKGNTFETVLMCINLSYELYSYIITFPCSSWQHRWVDTWWITWLLDFVSLCQQSLGLSLFCGCSNRFIGVVFCSWTVSRKYLLSSSSKIVVTTWIFRKYSVQRWNLCVPVRAREKRQSFSM